jgi:hypothetical protein
MKDRYEQEIEQLLSELEAETPEQASVPSDPTPPLDDQPSPFTPRPKQRPRLISPTKLAIVGAVVAVLGLLVAHVVWLSLAGLVVMAGAVAWMLFQRMGRQSQQYWRGRPVEPKPQGAWDRFRRWLAK